MLKNAICFLLNPFAFLAPKNRVAVLMYHSTGRNNAPSTVSPENFAKQMAFLEKNRYGVVSLASLVDILEKEEPIPAKTIVLTFDDGYLDNFVFAWPVLKQHGFPATVFLTTGTVGGEKIKKDGQRLKMLGWPEAGKMQKSGLVDFQPHTMSHPRLAQIAKEEAQKEIAGSLVAIEEKLGNRKERFFAYPYGDYNQDIVDILKANGFRAALTVKRGLVKKDSLLFELARIDLYNNTSLIEFRSKINFGLL
ncbi:MAG: polysaccharide deacetylase family protein [Candidatus Pacebacteria bacterium]|nr:polysaccharide deacetylase family protein [Candidatus Paceibacterota bacterium]